MLGSSSRSGALLAAAVVASVTLAACGSDDDSSSTSASSKTPAVSATASAATAKAAVAPYIGKPAPFPVDTPLEKRPPAGSKVAFMDCGTPTCAVLWQVIVPSAKAVGLDIYRVKTGTAANTINTAVSSIAEQHPKAVLDVATDPSLFAAGLKKLHDAKIPIIGSGVVNTDKYGFAGGLFGTAATQKVGRLLADYVYSEHGADSHSVFYYPPELAFAPIMKDAYVGEMKQLCPSCDTRTLAMPAATIGNTMPKAMASDLQAHPKTKTAVAATTEMFGGAPSAFKAAGVSVETTGSAGNPDNLQLIKSGQQSSSLFIDFPVLVWTLSDMLARSINGQALTPLEAQGAVVNQFLTKPDITFDPSKGWTGYPDFVQRFAKLWSAAS
jgi:ribose transport system substrate-binding protein